MDAYPGADPGTSLPRSRVPPLVINSSHGAHAAITAGANAMCSNTGACAEVTAGARAMGSSIIIAAANPS